MKYEFRRQSMSFVLLTFVFGVFAGCGSFGFGKSSGPETDHSRLSPEQSSERIEEILEAKDSTGAENTADDLPDSTEKCLQEVMRALLQCHVDLQDSVDSGQLERAPDCVSHFQKAVEHVASDVDGQIPGLGSALVARRSGSEELAAASPASSRPLACMASAVLWRSFFEPGNLDSARSIPIALRIVDATSKEHANALFGLPLWTRATFLSQAPENLGGNLAQAAQDLEMSHAMAGPLVPYVFALKGRYWCIARQDSQCLAEAETAFRSSPANPDVYRAANRLIQWVHARYNLIFPTGPLKQPPPENPPNPISEESSG